MKVRDLMATDVKCCSEFSSLNTAAQLMWDNDIGCVPVVDKDGRVIGMVTDRDICMAAYTQGGPLTSTLVTGAMSKQLFSCAPDDGLDFAEKLMREKQVRRLPAIDAKGHLAGIISLNDIAREGEREIEMKRPREVADADIVGLMASVCAPRHRVIAAQAA